MVKFLFKSGDRIKINGIMRTIEDRGYRDEWNRGEGHNQPIYLININGWKFVDQTDLLLWIKVDY